LSGAGSGAGASLSTSLLVQVPSAALQAGAPTFAAARAAAQATLASAVSAALGGCAVSVSGVLALSAALQSSAAQAAAAAVMVPLSLAPALAEVDSQRPLTGADESMLKASALSDGTASWAASTASARSTTTMRLSAITRRVSAFLAQFGLTLPEAAGIGAGALVVLVAAGVLMRRRRLQLEQQLVLAAAESSARRRKAAKAAGDVFDNPMMAARGRGRSGSGSSRKKKSRDGRKSVERFEVAPITRTGAIGRANSHAALGAISHAPNPPPIVVEEPVDAEETVTDAVAAEEVAVEVEAGPEVEAELEAEVEAEVEVEVSPPAREREHKRNALDELLDAARHWMLRHEDGKGGPIWRHGVSGKSQAHVPSDVLKAEAAQGLRAEQEARELASEWAAQTTDDGEVYYENVRDPDSATTWVKPQALRELHALEAANASRALRAEAGEFAAKYSAGEDLAVYTNLRTGETSESVPACVHRLARVDAAESARLDREEAADWNVVAAKKEGGAPTYEFLPDGSTTREKPAVLARVEELDARESKRQRAFAAGWAEAEDPDSGELYWYHAETDFTQWDLPSSKDIKAAAKRARVDPSERKAGAGAAHPPKRPATAAEREAAARRLLNVDAGMLRKRGFAAEAARHGVGAIAAFERDLRAVGLRSSQLAVFVDCSAANAQAGRRSFGGRGLHDVGGAARGLGLNPYEEALSDIAAPLEGFDEDGLIPLFGFAGKAGGAVFPIAPLGGSAGGGGAGDEGASCEGLGAVLATYRARVPHVAPGATRNLAPVVRKAIELVAAADRAGAPRELLIALVVTAGDSAARIALNSALVDASAYPIAFVIVGVGDGPFDGYAALDDEKGQRKFDNVTFVELEKVKAECAAARAPLGVGLALAALAEVPQVFAECRKAGLFSGAAE
jgi:E3 ubiquitin-protein ligase RGLG